MCDQTSVSARICAHGIIARMRIDDVLRRDPALDLTLVAGPWDARIVERVSVIDDTARIAAVRRGELVVLTRRASRSASGRGLIQLLAAAGEHGLAALALYGRATTSQAAIAAASGARVALLAIGIGEDPAALAFALEATLRADADAVLRRLTAAVAAIEHAEPDGTEAILVAASAALDAEVSCRDGVVSADRDDTAVRIGCRLVADAVARAASHPEPPVRRRDRRPGRARGPGRRRPRRAGGATTRPQGRVARRPRERRRSPLGRRRRGGHRGTADRAAAGLRGLWRRRRCQRSARGARSGARGTRHGRPASLRRHRPERLVYELAGSPTARSSATGLLAPLEQLGGPKATAAIETLRVYLDCWGSLARSGEILHLHPNAVAHRMKRIRALLPADLDDPDQRLALQIACRARTPPP